MLNAVCVCVCLLRCVRLFETPWNVVRQASLSMGFSREEYCSGLPFPSPGDRPDSGIEPAFSASPALAGGFFTTEPPGKRIECFGHMLSEIFKKANRTTIYNSFYIEFACGKVVLYKMSKMKCRNNFNPILKSSPALPDVCRVFETVCFEVCMEILIKLLPKLVLF